MIVGPHKSKVSWSLDRAQQQVKFFEKLDLSNKRTFHLIRLVPFNIEGACILINEYKVNHADTYACNMETTMANVKQGNLTRSPQWWKHLKDWKRVFWKSERQAQKKDIKSVDNN